MDEKLNISLDLTAQVVNMIMEQARYQARCAPTGTSPEKIIVTPDHVRDAANLVFLAIDLIRERNA